MAHWAEIDENNKVIRVVVTDNDDSAGDEGYSWLLNTLGGRWIKTSFNSFEGVHYLPNSERDADGNRVPSGQPHLRYNYAGVGFTYDEEHDAFIPPKPEPYFWPSGNVSDWRLNTDTFSWEVYTIRKSN